MDLATTQTLLSPAGRSLLDALPPYEEAGALRLGEDLRAAGYDAALVAAALTQSRLRARARRKLGDFADGMLFTADALEQATRLELAARHAHRFRAAGVHHVLDLGCGVGADALAMAGIGLRVSAVDADPVVAALARHNLRHFPEVSVQVAQAQDALSAVLKGADASVGTLAGALGQAAEPISRWGAWLDPARRTPGHADVQGRTRRRHHLSGLSPSWEFVQQVAAAIPATGAKLAPAFPHAAVPDGVEAAWTSYAGEVLECALWWGPLVRTPGRTATLVNPDPGVADVTVTQADAPELGPVAGALPAAGEFLYEPDRAVLRAGLVGALVAAVDGRELSHGVGYVVSPTAVAVTFARRYVITAALPWQVKPVRAWLRAQGVGRLTIKKRGLDVDADLVRRQLALDGRGDELTVVMTRVGMRPAFLVVEAS